MSELERLIKELCPNGVAFKKIKEVYKRIKGTPITAGKMKEIENPDTIKTLEKDEIEKRWDEI